jgi:hypothetical protein
MAYTGILQCKNDDGKEFTYRVLGVNGHLILQDDEKEYHFIEDQEPILIEKLKGQIDALRHIRKALSEALKPSHKSAMDAMQLFAHVDVDRDMDYEVARIARGAIKQYRAAH